MKIYTIVILAIGVASYRVGGWQALGLTAGASAASIVLGHALADRSLELAGYIVDRKGAKPRIGKRRAIRPTASETEWL